MKKLISLLVAALMVLSLCGSALAYSPEEPIHILFWHTRGSGAQQQTVDYQIDQFNATVGKEKGIEVEGVFMGGYADIMTKMQLASQSGGQPVVAVLGNTRVSIMVDDGIIEDMMPYAKRDGFDLSNFFDSMINVPGNDEEHLHSLPYIKSTPVLYYNKTLADAKGLTAPTSMEEFEAFAKALHEVDENGEVKVWGFECVNDFTYYQGAFLWQIKQPLWDAEGKSPALAGDGMLKILTDWHRWVDEGWCRPFDSTNASSTMTDLFYQGKLACFWNSCASMANVSKYSKEAGFELGVANLPQYDMDNKVVPIGGGNIGLMKTFNTEEQLNAGWEFIKFLFTDEMVAYNAINSGYLPTTKSVANSEAMIAFWNENPNWKLPYDQVDWGIEQAYPYFEGNSELKTNIQGAVSLLIQEQSITPEEAVEQIKGENEHLFENGF